MNVSRRHDVAVFGGGLAVGGVAAGAVTWKLLGNAKNAEQAAVKAASIKWGAIGLVGGAAIGAGLVLGGPKVLDAIKGALHIGN
jgi:hypothetical protein